MMFLFNFTANDILSHSGRRLRHNSWRKSDATQLNPLTDSAALWWLQLAAKTYQSASAYEDHENRDSRLLRNVDRYLPYCTAFHKLLSKHKKQIHRFGSLTILTTWFLILLQCIIFSRLVFGWWTVGHDGLGMQLGQILSNKKPCGLYRSTDVSAVKCRRLR